uniref:exodeoxyribonuclease III n=1 Tax=Rousettus aegyptiacus TaxID=9407 RepID=A0A7J8DXM3_ROUAE|nr:hypothetical protein HJG63_008354 [Rousettus aegyptiacus]
METLSYQKAIHKMAIRRPHISIITLNVNRLNSPVKKHRVAEWIKKQTPNICCLQEIHFHSKDKYKLKVKGWKMIFQANDILRRAEVSVLIDFQINNVKKDTEGHSIMIKGIMHQEDITFINIYTPSQGALKYVKQLLTELKGKTDQNTIITKDLNTPLSDMDRSSK